MTDLTAADGTPEEVLPGSPALTAQDDTHQRMESAPEATDAPEESEHEEPETFPRDYVEKLRKESAGYRDRAKRADDLAHRLHTALVTATGRLADATDLQFDEEHLEDPQALTQAIDGLLERKPHLASRTPRGNVGQGVGDATDTVDLAGLLRARAS
jgi:hypothetical protein